MPKNCNLAYFILQRLNTTVTKGIRLNYVYGKQLKDQNTLTGHYRCQYYSLISMVFDQYSLTTADVIYFSCTLLVVV